MILAIDQGTSGTTCLVFDERGQVAGRAYREFNQRPGWVEHDAAEIWDVTRSVAKEALDGAGVDGRGLAGIGITNQRETVVAWDRTTGEPLHRAIVWQDRRTAARCDELRESGLQEFVRERTGLVLDPYFSGTKIEWLIRHGRRSRRRRLRARSIPGSSSSSRASTSPPSRTPRARCCSTSASGAFRDDRAWRRVPGGGGDGHVDRGGRALDVARGRALRAVDVRGPARDAARWLGARVGACGQ